MSCSVRLICQRRAMISVLCPIDSPVRGSTTAGSTGLKCLGRRSNQGEMRCMALRPR